MEGPTRNVFVFCVVFMKWLNYVDCGGSLFNQEFYVMGRYEYNSTQTGIFGADMIGFGNAWLPEPTVLLWPNIIQKKTIRVGRDGVNVLWFRSDSLIFGLQAIHINILLGFPCFPMVFPWFFPDFPTLFLA